MSHPDCTDICEMVHFELGKLGFTISDDEDHTDMLDCLAKCKLIRADQPEKDKEWPMWVLSPEDIEGVAKERGVSFIGKDFDEIARITKKGIEAALCDVWEIAIEEALRNTEAEWKFNIVDTGLSDTSEFRNDKEYSLMEKWIGEVGCEADRETPVFAFELVHKERTDESSKNDVKITSIRHPGFNETEWEDMCLIMEEFILTAYKTTDWRQR
jgi:hypothetical protein